jgi:dienelactone hydrolase
MKKVISLFLFMLLTCSFGFADVVGKEVSYSDGKTTMKGYLAYDEAATEKRPGVLVVHEWWGHNDYARQRAEMLAKAGYVALAVDMYGDGKKAEHPEEAGQYMNEVKNNLSIMQSRFMAALDFLKKQQIVDTNKIAAIGYCFGGSTVLSMARQGVDDLKGVVSFHGGLGGLAPVETGKVKAKILVCNGAADTFVPAEQIDQFKKEMDAAGADYEFKSYEGAKHSFTNPQADELAKKFNMPIAYNAEADKQSWQDMLDLFNKIFK